MQAGTVVGDRFTVEHETGAGGMGTVYAAIDRVTGERVALKVLVRASALDAARFVRESQALAETDHPSVVRYVAHGTTPTGQLYLAMEWLEGEDLTARMARSGLTIAESVRLTHHVADGLGALHRRGIVHRDVKPSNIFLVTGEVERIKLLDLGIARMGSMAATLTRAGSLVGTPGYMAPEQARGQADVSPRADLFALGCVLFECLTGRPAFEGENVMALLAKILLADAPRARDLRPEVPVPLDDLCAWLLRKDPDERPESASVVIEALTSLERIDAPAPSAQAKRPRTPALTSSEQRLVCLLLAGDDSPNADSGDAPTMSSDAMTKELMRLRTRITAVGVRIERLVDGSLLGVAPRDADASEQAVAMARAALLLRAEMPGAPIAVATGRGDVSTPLPVGEVIDRAAKLFRISKRGHAPRPIVVDDVTAGMLASRFEIVRGDEARVLVTELNDTRAGARTLLGKQTPFVGRDREIAMLDGLVAECISEVSARAVLVTAPPGVGKSRLRHEVVSRACSAFPDLVVWIGRGDPMQAGSPFALLGHALRSATGIIDGESIVRRREKVRAHIDALDIRDRESVTAFACELVGAPSQGDRADVAAARNDAQLMNDQLRTTWHAWLEAETRAHPVMVVLEDLHWGDAPTVSFIDESLRMLAERPLFVLAMARPEVERVFPKLWAERGVQPLPLRELSKRASETLARHVLGATAAPAMVSDVVARAMGNAFFLEELLRAVAERGDVRMLPETVLAVVESRLDSLDPDGRRVLRAASVFGEKFHAGGVKVLLGDDNIDVKAWLELLIRRESIVARDESSIPLEAEFVFRHALVREAAYAMLTDKDRKLGHLLAATWLESKGVSDAVLLAEHYERADARSRAAAFFLRAARQCIAGNDLEGALATVERGLACADDPTSRADLHLVRAEVHYWRGEFESVERAAREAIALVSRDTNAWWIAVERLIDAAGKLSRVEELLATVERMEQVCATATVSRHVVSAISAAVGALVDLGRYDIAKRLLDWCAAAARDVLAGEATSAARFAQARARLDLAFGDIGAFRSNMAFAQTVYEGSGAMRHSAHCILSSAYGALLLGRFEEAAEELRRSVGIAAELDIQVGVLAGKQNLGLALLRLGRVEESIALEREALELSRAQRNVRLEGACLYYLSLAFHARGDFIEAENHALESARVCEQIPPSRAEALAALAQARLAKGDVPRALENAKEAMAILLAVGGVDEGEPLIRLVHAEALRATGSLDESRAAIVDARSHVEARAGKIADESARETFLAISEHARTVELAELWARL